MINKFMLFIIVLILSISLVSADNSSINMFSESDILAPPAVPLRVAEVTNTLTLELKEVVNNDIILDVHADLELKNLDTEDIIKTKKYISGEILSLDLIPADWSIKLKLDDISTPGKDYFVNLNVDLTRSNISKTVYASPVGSLRGIVYIGEKAARNTELKFECSGSYGELEDIWTDKYGSFTKDCLPIGSCKVSAIKNDKVGYMTIDIQQGEIQDIEIKLDVDILSEFTVFKVLVVILVIISLIFVFIYFKKHKTDKKETTKGILVTPRMESIIETFSDKEKEVVGFLIENLGETTQPKIYHSTGIAKTSLVRIIDSLKAKKIIETKKFGKINKIKLTQWFLTNKEK